MSKPVGRAAIAEAHKALRNWGRWGKEDQIGTLNNVSASDIVKAAALVRKGKTFGMGIPLGETGPQNGLHRGACQCPAVQTAPDNAAPVRRIRCPGG